MLIFLRLLAVTTLSILPGCVDSPKSPHIDVHDLVTRLNDGRSLAEAGTADDQYRIGLRQERFSLDYREAVRLYRLAAQQHHGEAMYRLCILSDNGRGIPQDFEEALRWCRRAADAGHARAMLTIGTFYERGRGVPKDWGQAYHWYNLAAAYGLEEGVKRRDRLAEQMTALQLAQAQFRSRNWKPVEGSPFDQ